MTLPRVRTKTDRTASKKKLPPEVYSFSDLPMTPEVRAIIEQSKAEARAKRR